MEVCIMFICYHSQKYVALILLSQMLCADQRGGFIHHWCDLPSPL